jgi:glycosyltransferase involved in cell wall biosynthesis
MDAVVVHTEHGAGRLAVDFGVDPAKLEVIPHGAFDYLTGQRDEVPLPPELAAVEGPVIMAFGLVRPYKGTDVLLEAFAKLDGAELWIVGMPRMPMEPLHELAARARGTVRFVDRFVTDPEIPAYMRRADLVVLPYRNIEQSGVLYTALAFGRPLVLSEVGGFPEIAAQGAARTVPPGDPAALGAALAQLLADPPERARLAAGALAAARGRYSWDQIGCETAALYRRLLDGAG